MGIQAKGWSILQTKLIPPAKRGGTVQRGRLVSRAVQGAQGRLVLVVAGAGYGKTSLLGQVHETLLGRSRSVGWISLDESDNDLARFLAHLIEPIRRSDPQFGLSTDALLRSGVPLPPSILRSSLLNELSALQGDLHVFLDDYHLITDSEVRATINDLLLAPLPRLHLLVASRSANELPVARLRALGHLAEIQAEDLAFSDDEATDLLARAGRYALDRSQVSLIREKTEGWAASLQLASIALRDADDVQRVLDSFSGESRSIGELLSAEVLTRQSAEVHEFLLFTSILRQFNTGLANAVCARDNSRSMLDTVESQNLFIFSLDDHRNWYRYHHLFQEFLRRQLTDRYPDLVPALHQRAVAWLTAQGSVPEAIDHALQAGDVAQAASLLDEASTQLFATGQIRTLERYVGMLPTKRVRQLPVLQLELSWHEQLEWRFDKARESLDSVSRLLDSEEPGPGSETNVERRRELVSKLAHRRMMLKVLSDDLATVVEDCERWHATTPSDDPFMVASVGTAKMMARREHYEFQDVPAQAVSLRELFIKGGAIYGTVFHDCATGLALLAHGDIEEATVVVTRARDCAVKLHGLQSKLASMPVALLAELAYERGNTVEARDLLAVHCSLSVESGFVDHAIARFVTASRLDFLDNRPDDAMSALDAGMSIATRKGLQRVRVQLLAERARQMVLSGREKSIREILEEAVRGYDARMPVPGLAPTMTDEAVAVIRARDAAGHSNLRDAIALIRRWLTFARSRRAGRSVARLSAVLAGLVARTGDIAAASRVIVECLTATPRFLFVRTLLDEGPFIVPVLEHLRDTVPQTQFDLQEKVRRVLDSQHGRPVATSPTRTPPGARPVDTLCARELEIIRLSAQGMRTSDISRSVCLSDSTVKWYWNRIFSKLDVHRRFDAVQVARQHGWIA